MVISANRYLTEKEMYVNAKYIWNKLKAFGWNEKAIAGLLGNTHVESGHNPGIWEGLNPNNTSRGFGLVQYTPASMILERASSVGKSAGNIDFQLELIDSDYFGHWIPTSNYDFSYSAFKSNSVNLSEVKLADAFLKNFERPANQNQPARGQHANYWLSTFNKSGSSGPKIVENGGQIEKAIQWMIARQGKVTYSMSYRNGPNSYDCSSAVFTALKHAGFPIPFVGNTETLYSMEGDLLIPISSSEKRRGDIFVSGNKGGSNNAYGHTGFCLNETQAIHCSSVFNGIGVSSNANTSIRAYSGAPVYWYRVAGSNIASPTPDVEEDEEDKNIYINEVNDGLEYVEQEQLISLFGRRFGEETFKDVESPNDLLQRAKDWLNTQPLDITSVSLDYLQLDKMDKRYKELRAGDVVTVRNDDLNINTRMRIENKSFSLDEPELGYLDLGKQVIRISDWIANPDLLITLNTRIR